MPVTPPDFGDRPIHVWFSHFPHAACRAHGSRPNDLMILVHPGCMIQDIRNIDLYRTMGVDDAADRVKLHIVGGFIHWDELVRFALASVLPVLEEAPIFHHDPVDLRGYDEVCHEGTAIGRWRAKSERMRPR